MSTSRGLEVEVEQLTAPVCLGEGPHYDPEDEVLYFVSIFDKTVHMYDPSTERVYAGELDGMPTFIIPVFGHKNRFVVGLGRRVLEITWDPRAAGEDSEPKVLRVIAEVDQDKPDNRLNDAKADPRGRLFAGTMGHEYAPGQFRRKQGSLYRIDPNGDVTTLEDHIDISNGLCWDLRRKAFYFADSFEYAIRRYDYDVENGNISNPRTVFTLADHSLPGIADGMTIDTDGKLWVANFDGQQVLQICPSSGRLLRRVRTPAPQTTSVSFGGRMMDELYVTSAALDRGAHQPPPPAAAGALFRVRALGVRGRADERVRLQ